MNDKWRVEWQRGLDELDREQRRLNRQRLRHTVSLEAYNEWLLEQEEILNDDN